MARELEQKIDELGEARVAAFIAEPVQGAGGVIIPPDSYWPEIKRICAERDILLIMDEVICGFGRTGNWFGCQTYDLEPDLMTFAKAVTNGYIPLGGVMVGDKVADVLLSHEGEFAHGLTYSGHPVACAAASQPCKCCARKRLLRVRPANSRPISRNACKPWQTIASWARCAACGMLAAVELVRDKHSRERLAPDAAGAVFCRNQANRGGLMVRQTGDAMIMAPPLICNRGDRYTGGEAGTGPGPDRRPLQHRLR